LLINSFSAETFLGYCFCQCNSRNGAALNSNKRKIC
jgi:hypothetical protein